MSNVVLKLVRDLANLLARYKEEARIVAKTAWLTALKGRKLTPEEYLKEMGPIFDENDFQAIVEMKAISLIGHLLMDLKIPEDKWQQPGSIILGTASWSLGFEHYIYEHQHLYKSVLNSRLPINRLMAYEYIYGDRRLVRQAARSWDVINKIKQYRYVNTAISK